MTTAVLVLFSALLTLAVVTACVLPPLVHAAREAPAKVEMH